MRTLRTSEAAAFVGVSPHTLRAWERRFAFPHPRRSPGGHRAYLACELAPLREALRQGLSTSSAIRLARDAADFDVQQLAAELAAFEAARVDAALDRALAAHSVERTVEELLLPAVGLVERHHQTRSAATAFARAQAVDWLRRLTRLTPPAHFGAVLVCDASADAGERVATSALALFLARSGLAPLVLEVAARADLAAAVATVQPVALVVSGRAASRDAATWLRAAHAGARAPVALFRCGAGSPTHGERLPEGPLAAAASVVALVGRDPA